MKAITLLSATLFALFASVSTSAAIDRPIVFIPGILGSRLIDQQKNVVWGDIYSLSRLQTLTVEDGPDDPHDRLKADSIVTNIQIFGPFKVKEYSSLRHTLIDNLGYQAGVTYFEFPYDWRQSNFKTANDFAEFVRNTPQLNNHQFDILAHSMGGLVAEIYAKQIDHGVHVRRIINMGVPFLGSADTFAALSAGWGPIGNTLAGGLDSIRKFALSIPSFYELMPRYQYCCIFGLPTDSSRAPFYPTTFGGWEKLSWDNAPTPINQSKLKNVLAKTTQLRDLASLPYPPTIQVFNIVGTGLDTAIQFYIDPKSHEVGSFILDLGDGTVPQVSASNLDVARSYVSFHKHETIFEDESAKATLRNILSGPTPPTHFANSAMSVLTNDGPAAISSVGISLSPAIVSPGGEVAITITISGPVDASLDKVKMSLSCEDSKGHREDLQMQPTLDREAIYSKAFYRSHYQAGQDPGPVIVTANIMGLTGSTTVPLEDYFYIIPRHKRG